MGIRILLAWSAAPGSGDKQYAYVTVMLHTQSCTVYQLITTGLSHLYCTGAASSTQGVYMHICIRLLSMLSIEADVQQAIKAAAAAKRAGLRKLNTYNYVSWQAGLSMPQSMQASYTVKGNNNVHTGTWITCSRG